MNFNVENEYFEYIFFENDMYLYIFSCLLLLNDFYSLVIKMIKF